MKRKSGSTPDGSDEQECKDILPFSDNRETKPIKGISSKVSFDYGELGQRLGSIQTPKGVDETMKGKSSSTLFDPEGKIPDFTFSETKEVDSMKGKSSSTFFGFEAQIRYILGGVGSPTKKSSSNSGGCYDVVLDFDNRLPDKATGLTLSKRLRTCMERFQIYVSAPDGDVLELGVTGKVFIPVFSRGFASNESCLRNLVSMVDCRSYSATNHILPIFLGVKPSDVRLDTPSYREGLDKPRRSVEDRVINRWIEALVDVSNISGLSIPETAGLDEIVDLVNNEVCQMVLHKLRLSQLSKGTYLAGIGEHVDRITEMLNLGVNDVELIKITGEDGVGKTLARAVYDKLSSSFEGCSFISRINEWDWTPKNIIKFQARLVSDLLSREVGVFQSVDEGRDLIRERFCHMKVLIVLDDFWEIHQFVGELNWFGPGSRIIITSRTRRPLGFDCSIYDLSSGGHRLISSDETALELFNNHAFTKSHPSPAFLALAEELSKAIARRSRFCPLAIELVGSLLYGKSEAGWKNMSLHLKQQDDEFFKDLSGILWMSYDNLTEKQKDMFLDVSCLPNDGIGRRIALYLWDDYSQHSHDFEVLIRLSLVKIDANDGIRMHPFVWSFGIEILERKQRLGWATDTEVDVGSMRFFKMVNEDVIINRRWREGRDLIVRSQFPYLPQGVHHTKSLKILNLSRSKITEKWETWHQIQAPQLRVLNLTGCVDLMVTPDFSFCPDLEILILEHCSQLVKIHHSIQGLQRLAILNLRYCTELSMLPKEIGRLTALKELLMDGTSIQEIPISIGHLKKLQVLTAINCSSLTQLPSSTRDLLFITTLKLDCAKIAKLPRTILQKMKLQYLSLRDCRHITSLGSFVGEVERSLIELDISGTSIFELPKSISKLKILRVLRMEFCFIREFPPDFSELKRLEEVHASWCKGLENLPHDIGGVKSLRILKVGHSRISGLPESIQLLEHLEFLDCTSCNKLQGLPELPSSLTTLHVQSQEFKALPDLHNLVNLKEFTLGSDVPVHSVSLHLSVDPFDWLKSSASLRTLVLCLPHTKGLPGFPPGLRKLTLQCTNLEHIPSFPSTLVALSIQNFRLLKELPNVKNLQNLQEMEVVCCPEIEEIEGLGSLKALKILTVLDCGIELLDGIDELLSLRRLTLQDCRSLRKLPNLERLKNLVEMKIIGCSEIQRITVLGRLERLQVLSI